MSSKALSFDSAAFDAFAADYDATFTDSTLGRLLRPRVWEVLAQHFQPGDHILELACGTGEDAVWLAQRGLHVTATDGSVQMVAQTQAKAQAAGVKEQVNAVQMSLQQLVRGQGAGGRGQGSGVTKQGAGSRGVFDFAQGTPSSPPALQSSNPPPLQSSTPPFLHPSLPFSGLFSNFGGLNTINDWRGLARSLAHLIKPGGKVILVPMGPLCPWEIGWHLLHGQVSTAFRRLGESAPAKIGEAVIPIWYPSALRLKADFERWFNHLETQSLGLWLPPSYLGHFVERWPTLFKRLNQWERATATLTGGWGDHYLIVFERKSL